VQAEYAQLEEAPLVQLIQAEKKSLQVCSGVFAFSLYHNMKGNFGVRSINSSPALILSRNRSKFIATSYISISHSLECQKVCTAIDAGASAERSAAFCTVGLT